MSKRSELGFFNTTCIYHFINLGTLKPGSMRMLCLLLTFIFSSTSYSQYSTYQDSLIQLSKTLSDKNEQAKVLNQIIWSFNRNVEVAEPFLDQYDEVGDELDSDDIRQRAFYQRGVIYRVAGRFVEALNSLNKCESISRRIKDEVMLANVTYQIGALYNAQARYEESFEVLLEALILFESQKDRSSEALVLNVLAIGYKKIGRRDDAESTMLKALSIYESLEDDGGQADVSHNLGNFYSENEDFEKALEYYRNQEVLDKKTNYQPGLAFLYEAMGNVFSLQNLDKKANAKLSEALEIWQVIQGRKQEAAVLIKLGLNESKLGSSSNGRKRVLKALDIATEEEDLENIQEAKLALAKLSELDGKYKEAYHFQLQYESLKDSLRSEKVTTQINSLTASYEAEKKEKEIELLKSENLLKDEQLSKRRIQQRLFAALSFFLIGIILLLNMYFSQRRKLRESEYNQEIKHKVNAIERLNGRISDLLDQKDKLELRPQDEINELLDSQLTDKEYEVLNAIAKGNTNKEIAESQFISENTVKFHLKNLYSKLDVSNRKEAVKKIASLVQL